jgi:transcriptional regulator with XRE-family HTH domain
MTRLGQLLRLYRAANCLTVRQLGAEIGIHYSAVSRLEHRTSAGMSAESLLKVTSWLLQQQNGTETVESVPHG